MNLFDAVLTGLMTLARFSIFHCCIFISRGFILFIENGSSLAFSETFSFLINYTLYVSLDESIL